MAQQIHDCALLKIVEMMTLILANASCVETAGTVKNATKSMLFKMTNAHVSIVTLYTYTYPMDHNVLIHRMLS